jgi:hypothetical protein
MQTDIQSGGISVAVGASFLRFPAASGGFPGAPEPGALAPTVIALVLVCGWRLERSLGENFPNPGKHPHKTMHSIRR